MEYRSFSPRQRLTMTWWNRTEYQRKDGILCDGSVRSGKTNAMAVGFLLWSMSQFDGQRFAFCGKTIETLRRNVTDLLPIWLEGVYTIQELRSENRLTISDGVHTNTYFLFGGRDESSYMLIQGLTLAGVLFDEAALMPRSFVEQALARCSVEGAKFWFNCNPESPEHWFYKEWVRKITQRNLLYLHFTMADNPSLSEQVRSRYERMYSGVFYERYILGLWAAADGLVYDGFSLERHTSQQLPETSGSCYISVDYGTRNPTVFLLWQCAADGRWVCRKEYHWDGRANRRQKTDREYADALSEFFDGEYLRTVIVDPSASSFITELRQRGIQVQTADNRVLDGIRTVSDLLRSDGLLFSTECSHTIEEFRSYVWDDSAGALGVDKPLKEHDHCMDAVRYFVMTVLNRSGARVKKRPKGL